MVSNIVNDVLSKKNREKEVFNSNNVSSGVNGGKATVSINETYSFQTEEDYPLNRKVDIKIKFDGYLENNFSMHGEVDFGPSVGQELL